VSPATHDAQTRRRSTSKTNSNIYFHWVQAGTLLEVQCTAIANGVSLTAKTKFNVLAPSFSIRICPTNTPALDENYFAPETGGPYLHFGDAQYTPGVTLEGTPTALVQSNYSVTFFQVIDTSMTKRWSNTVRQARSIAEVLDTGITTFNLTNSSGTPYIWSNDSPGEPAPLSYQGLSRQESFSAFVMYKSSASSSIWVPMTVGTWSWGGIGTNSGSWTLVSSNYAPLSCTTSTGTAGFPQWTNIFNNVKTNYVNF
jgi:hypothetical protein